VSSSSEYDVTGTVVVSKPDAVRDEVRRIFECVCPDASFDALSQAFEVFERLFQGGLPGFAGCDTVYHDMQHSLDVTLAMSRLLGGYEKSREDHPRLGSDLVSVGIVAALFHDAGYIQRDDDDNHVNGAQYTKQHISRGATFLGEFMPQFGLGEYLEVAIEAVHFTGYERPLASLGTNAPKTRVLGTLLGTADLVAQMSDRCYLEKCRDRLYPEFVLGGLAVDREHNGATRVQYGSGEDLLQKTPAFFRTVTQERLDGEFGRAYRFFKDWFEGPDPYSAAIRKNLRYLDEVLKDGDWSKLRRTPPVFTSQEDSLSDTQRMARAHLDQMIRDQESS
jgi:hypothetical protein